MTGTENQKPNTDAIDKHASGEPTTVFMEDAPVAVSAPAPEVAEKPAKKPKARNKGVDTAVSVSAAGSGTGSADVSADKTGSAKLSSSVLPGRASAVKFFVSRTSVFADGYDMERERLAVLQLISRSQSGEEIASSDPLFDRWMLYEDRFVAFAKLMAQRQTRAAEPAQVTRSEVAAYKSLGTLANDVEDGDDTVELHTKEAFLLFLGRAQDPDAVTVAAPNVSAGSADGGVAGTKNASNAPARIISFKKVGASYRMLSSLSANNNPYADWALIELTARRDELQKHLSESTAALEQTIEDIRKSRGITIVKARSTTPQKLPIRFKSSYGHAMVETLAEFDYLVRLIRTLVFKARLTVPLADQMIRDLMRRFRGHFNAVKSYERLLADPDVMLLTRNDFLPTADDVARKRVARMVETFGQVPRAIFEMSVEPQYKSHKADLNPNELALLRKVTTGVLDFAEDDAFEAASGTARQLL